jgi:hypothetical protein
VELVEQLRAGPLAKLERSEELLVLFHGYSDLERFGAEVAAANYRLPWLSPGNERERLTVRAEGQGGDVLEVQRIAGMLPRFSD